MIGSPREIDVIHQIWLYLGLFSEGAVRNLCPSISRRSRGQNVLAPRSVSVHGFCSALITCCCLTILLFRPSGNLAAQSNIEPVRISMMTDKEKYLQGEVISILIEVSSVSDDSMRLATIGNCKLYKQNSLGKDEYTMQCVDCMDFYATLSPHETDIFRLTADFLLLETRKPDDRVSLEEGEYVLGIIFRVVLSDGTEIVKPVNANIQLYKDPDIASAADSIWVWKHRFAKLEESKWRDEYDRIEAESSDGALRNSIVRSYHSSRVAKWATRGIKKEEWIRTLSEYIDARPNEVLSGFLFLTLSQNRHLDEYYAKRRSYIDSSTALVPRIVKILKAQKQK
jgi:hypothetical protein